jgi:hypothetical protein
MRTDHISTVNLQHKGWAYLTCSVLSSRELLVTRLPCRVKSPHVF